MIFIFSFKIVGLLASIVVLIVILAVGPVFRTLPNSCLAAIIVTAMKNMLLQTKQLGAVRKLRHHFFGHFGPLPSPLSSLFFVKTGSK
jgi:hypothetical protein